MDPRTVVAAAQAALYDRWSALPASEFGMFILGSPARRVWRDRTITEAQRQRCANAIYHEHIDDDDPLTDDERADIRRLYREVRHAR